MKKQREEGAEKNFRKMRWPCMSCYLSSDPSRHDNFMKPFEDFGVRWAAVGRRARNSASSAAIRTTSRKRSVRIWAGRSAATRTTNSSKSAALHPHKRAKSAASAAGRSPVRIFGLWIGVIAPKRTGASNARSAARSRQRKGSVVIWQRTSRDPLKQLQDRSLARLASRLCHERSSVRIHQRASSISGSHRLATSAVRRASTSRVARKDSASSERHCIRLRFWMSASFHSSPRKREARMHARGMQTERRRCVTR